MRYLIVMATILLTLPAISQQSTLKGAVKDTSDHKNLQNTTVSLLRQKDSTLIKFARTDAIGNFSLNKIDSGNYILFITHPYLADYFDNIHLVSAETKDMGNISLTSKSKLLAEVIVRSGAPIRIKGDTTIYTADSFRVRAGANVEEMLRTMPGISVDKDGKIVAMGERVTKVLVDGEEFFGTDPGIATKNLRADMIQEVQVFDKKSDQAEFTGIDDGVKDKTINLKLKEDKKNGYFGKVEGGVGIKDKFNNAAMLNAFKAKRKIAGYGLMSNTGQVNLDWQDDQNYGGNNGMMEMVDEGFIMFGGGGDDYNDYWNGRNGIPTNWNAGLHFSDKYNNNRQSVNGGFKFAKINSPGETSTFSKTFLKDTSWFNNTRSRNYSSVIKNSFNLTVETNLDSLNSFKWVTKATSNKTISTKDFYAETLNEDQQFINRNQRFTTNDVDNKSFNTNLLWRRKFKKTGRSLSINGIFNWTQSKSEGLLQSRIDYFNNGSFLRYDSLDQQNFKDNTGKTMSAKVVYTEPLMKDLFMELNYDVSYNTNDNDRIINSKNNSGKYEQRVDSLSNSFTFNRLINTPGVSFKLNKKKYNVTVGNAVGLNRFVQDNNTTDTRYRYNFLNMFPRVNALYKFKPSLSTRFNYTGNSTAPTLEQLQPIRVNTDPLNIYVGNQDLRQSFRHNASLSFNGYNPLKQRSLWSNFSYSTTQNAFVQLNIIDSGVRTYQTVNADGQYTLDFYLDYGIKIGESKFRVGINPVFNKNRRVDFVRNGKFAETIKNFTTTTGYGSGISLNYSEEKKMRFNINSTFTQQISKGTVNKNADIKYWQIEGWGQAVIQITKSLELMSEVNTEIRQKDPNFPAKSSFTKWDAFLTKRFFKDNALELKLSVIDILNQNRGYERNFNSSSFTETYHTTLKRFGGLSVIWNISKNGKAPSF